jgi:hypothetical protein
VLIKHVLRAMPVFHFMAMELTADGYRQLEHLCQNFLWGSNAAGRAKIPLVARSTVTCKKVDRSLGLIDFKEQAP